MFVNANFLALLAACINIVAWVSERAFIVQHVSVAVTQPIRDH